MRLHWRLDIISKSELTINKMKAFTLLVALLSSTFALPLFDDFQEDFDSRIVGGNITSIAEHPHQVSLRELNRYSCGGSILTPTRALTAAHCLQPRAPPSDYSIVAGSTLRNGDANAQIRRLNRFLRHPDNNAARVTNDIAILYWEQPLTFGATVRAIALPPQGSPVPYGRACTVTGWGKTSEGGVVADKLRVITKPIISNKECNRAYEGRVTSDMMCAGVAAGGIGVCHGDSGGPLLVNKVIFGVVSWGWGCARPRSPAVYARVPFFTNWIRKNM